MAFIDRSRVVLDWKCPRARYWGNEYGGLGVQPARRALYFDVGDAVHKGLEALCWGGDVEEVIGDNVRPFEALLRQGGLIEEKVLEQGALVEGLLRGFHLRVLPAILAEYEPVSVEAEFVMALGPHQWGVKPDSLWRRRADGTLWYREWKTTSSLNDRWFTQWPKAIQLHSTALAIEQHLGTPIEGVIVQGLYKGYEREGKQLSPFCYGYAKGGNFGDGVDYKWRPGSTRVPVWERRGGVRDWVMHMPQEILQEQFAETTPIFLQRRLAGALTRQVMTRENAIEEAGACLEACRLAGDTAEAQVILDTVFPQHFDQCQPPIGAPCAYGDCCFNPHVGADPIGSRLYVWRTPHHSTDTQGLAALAAKTGQVTDAPASDGRPQSQAEGV
jgi:hypothetical protein